MAFRFYLDTSVIGGVFDPEFRSSGRQFIDEVLARDDRFVISPLVVDELENAPLKVREFLRGLSKHLDVHPLDSRVILLRNAYIKAGILTPKWLSDAAHVATATVSGCRAIVSWNFRHIVHMDKIPRYNFVSQQLGYGEIAIHTPDEVLNYGDERI